MEKEEKELKLQQNREKIEQLIDEVMAILKDSKDNLDSDDCMIIGGTFKGYTKGDNVMCLSGSAIKILLLLDSLVDKVSETIIKTKNSHSNNG